FSDDLAESLKGVSSEREVVVIGHESLVVNGAKKAGLKCHPVCELTDLDGNTTLTGSFIARSDDSAKTLKDLGGRRMLTGASETDGISAAGLDALRRAAVEPGSKPQNRPAYTDAALDVLDSQGSPPPVAVIPSYGLRLLEGCGSVKPGSLKVI